MRANLTYNQISQLRKARLSLTLLFILRWLHMDWYAVHTKPRQEHRALVNLERQGYQCYLPLLIVEKIRQKRVVPTEEPLFPRYLFISLDSSMTGKSWGPIRSTLGVSRLVSFGQDPTRVDPALIDLLRQHDAVRHEAPQRLFERGEAVVIREGPFAGIQAVYQMADGESRAMVLLEILSKPTSLKIDVSSLRKAG